MTQPQFGQKRVPATYVGQHDTFVRPGSNNGPVMYVEALTLKSRPGEGTTLTFTGPTYILKYGKGVGGPVTKTAQGRDTWTLPGDTMVMKLVPMEEAG